MGLDLGKVTNRRCYTQKLQPPIQLIRLKLLFPENTFLNNCHLSILCHQQVVNSLS